MNEVKQYTKKIDKIEAIKLKLDTIPQEVYLFDKKYDVFQDEKSAYIELESANDTIVVRNGDYLVKDYTGYIFSYRPKSFNNSHVLINNKD